MSVVESDMRLQVQAGLRYLVDEKVLRRIDVHFGRELAEAPHLSLAQVIVASRLLRLYRHSLESLALLPPEEELITNWAVEQHEYMDEEEVSLIAELARVPDLACVPLSSEPSEPGSQDTSCDSPGKDEHKQNVIPRIYIEEKRIFVEFPFHRSKVNALQPLKETIEDWGYNRYKRNEWSYPQNAAWTVYTAIRDFHEFAYSSEALDCIKYAYRKDALAYQASEEETRWQKLTQLAVLEAAQPYLNGLPTANGQRLFRHQREAVQRMIEAPQQRFILAHKMGLGKSRTALIAAQAYALPIWGLVPAGTIINWQREAAAVDVQITLYSWAKLPEPPLDLDYVLIVDEAHYAQGAESTIRGKGFLRLADSARAVFMLTGTPIKNSLPINLWPLLVAARHPLAADRSTYEQRYCGAYMRQFGRKKYALDISGADHLDELHEYTRDIILYKTKSECIDLPDKIRIWRQAEVTESGEIAYRKTIEYLRVAHLERMADKREALRIGRDELLGEGTSEDDLGEASLESEYVSALVELGIYRHAASLAKVECAVEIAQEALEQGQCPLLFSAFRDTAERIATRLRADCLTGEVTGKRRQAMIDRFQSGESQVLVCTIGAGGIGINLTAAQVVVLVDREWTPGDTEQAEDRAHRIGTRHNVTSIWLQYGPADERIDALLQLKQERIDLILRGRHKSLHSSPSIRALAREIMESIHTGVPLAALLDLNPAELEPQVVDLVRDDVLTRPTSDGKKDGRLKGVARRVRMNVTLDEEVVAFLRSMKASNQTTAKEGGYSGFLERLVRESAEYKHRSD